MGRDNAKKKILIFLLKGFSDKQTVTSIADAIGVSRVGAWKSLKEIEAEGIVTLSPTGKGRTSTFTVALNLDNILTQKNIETYLTEEAIESQRWRSGFEALGQKVSFLIIYGSILHSPREANDIDIICVVSRKSAFKGVEDALRTAQKTQLKRIHSYNLTEAEFRSELKKPNLVFVDAIRKGVVIFGQDDFVRFMKGVIE